MVQLLLIVLMAKYVFRYHSNSLNESLKDLYEFDNYDEMIKSLFKVECGYDKNGVCPFSIVDHPFSFDNRLGWKNVHLLSICYEKKAVGVLGYYVENYSIEKTLINYKAFCIKRDNEFKRKLKI